MEIHYQVVYARGDGGGYNTYRIPALAVTNKGTILAFCEARKNSKADNGDIDMLLKRSFDNGKTWNAGKVLEPERAAYSDLCVLPDMSVGSLYECGRGGRSVYDSIMFARFNLEWLTDGADSIRTKKK